MADTKREGDFDELLLQGSTGISEEDQAEIIAQIDQVAQQNKIQAGPEAFIVKATKKGFVAPLAVNLLAVAFLAVGLTGLYFLFRFTDNAQTSQTQIFSTAEGKLIQELKKEAAGKLTAKDQEIVSIQDRLSSIDKERKDLQNNFDSKVQDKETELRAQMQKELEAERQRLRSQGLSEGDIQQRIRRLEEEKTAAFQRTLNDFRAQAQKEKAALEDNLKRTQSDFQKALTDASSERQKIMQDAQQREATLRAQMDEKNKNTAEENAASQAKLASAQSQLADLNQQKEKLSSFEGQIAGLYTTIAQDMQGRKFNEAKTHITALKSYLADPAVVALAPLQKRRDADLALASTLEDVVGQEISRMDADAAKLGKTDDTVDVIKSMAAAADKELAVGNTDRAEQLYLQALTKIPEVLASHEYFLKKKLREDQKKQQDLEQGLAQAEQAFNAGQYQQAMTYYSLALKAVPMGAVQRDAFLGKVQEAGYQLLTAEKKSSPAPAGALKDADAFLSGKRFDEAIGSYVGFLEKYPTDAQAANALSGIRKSLEARSQTVSSGLTTVQLANLQTEKDNLEKTLKTLQDQQAKDKKQWSEMEAGFKTQIANLEKQAEDLKKNQGVIAATTSSNGQEPSKEVKEELARLQAVVKEYQRIQELYKDYTTQEDATLKAGSDDKQILKARIYLDNFLSSQEVNTAFPGFKDRVGSYYTTYKNVGEKELLINITDVITNMGKLTTLIERQAYLRNIQRRYAGDKGMSDFLKGLETILKK